MAAIVSLNEPVEQLKSIFMPLKSYCTVPISCFNLKSIADIVKAPQLNVVVIYMSPSITNQLEVAASTVKRAETEYGKYFNVLVVNLNLGLLINFFFVFVFFQRRQ